MASQQDSGRKENGWGYHPEDVRIEGRRKAQKTLDRRRDLQLAAADRRETAYAGFLPIAADLQERLHLRARIDASLRVPKGRTSMYLSTDIATGLVGMMIMGLESVRAIWKLALEVEPARALGLDRFYGEDTLRRMLDQIQPEHPQQLRAVQRAIRHQEYRRIVGSRGDVDVDVDFSPLPSRARKREGSVYGYVGPRQKKRCYQSWRINVNGYPWEGDITPGNVYSDECFDLGLQAAAEIAPNEPKRRVCLRADAFFFSFDRLQRMLELSRQRPNFRFYIMAHATHKDHFVRRVARTYSDRPGWQRYSNTGSTELLDLGTIEVHKAEKDKAVEVPRVILIRETLQYSRRRGRQREQIKRQRYRLLLCCAPKKEEPDAATVYGKYQARQVQEHSFCDSKQGFAKLKFPAREFEANRFWYQCAMLAQACLWLHKKKMLPPQQEGLYSKTIRETLIRVGGKNRGTAHDPNPGTPPRATA